MLTFDHSVKVNGRWFKAGEQVDFPALNTPKAVEENTKKAEVKEEVVVEEEPAPEPAKRSYNKRK